MTRKNPLIPGLGTASEWTSITPAQLLEICKPFMSTAKQKSDQECSALTDQIPAITENYVRYLIMLTRLGAYQSTSRLAASARSSLGPRSSLSLLQLKHLVLDLQSATQADPGLYNKEQHCVEYVRGYLAMNDRLRSPITPPSSLSGLFGYMDGALWITQPGNARRCRLISWMKGVASKVMGMMISALRIKA